MNVNLQIEKLGENNYDVWSLYVRSVLITTDLWNVVCGKYVKAENATPEEAQKWETVDQKALACLILNITPTQLMHIKSCTTAAEAWTKLRDIHLPVGPVKKVQHYQKLLRLNMQHGENLVDYVNEFVATVDKLAELEIQIGDELQVVMLLSGLPDSWENFIAAIETQVKLPTFHTVKAKILEEGACRQEKEHRECTQTVYTKDANHYQIPSRTEAPRSTKKLPEPTYKIETEENQRFATNIKEKCNNFDYKSLIGDIIIHMNELTTESKFKYTYVAGKLTIEVINKIEKEAINQPSLTNISPPAEVRTIDGYWIKFLNGVELKPYNIYGARKVLRPHQLDIDENLSNQFRLHNPELSFAKYIKGLVKQTEKGKRLFRIYYFDEQ